MPDFYTALRQQGLSHLIPPAHKQRPSIPRTITYQRSSPSRVTSYEQKRAADWQAHCDAVWPEYRGHSFIEAQKPMSKSQLKARHDYAMSVFDRALGQLQSFERAGRW